MNLLPEDVNTPDKVEAVFEFVIAIATLLNKEVFLTPELGEESTEKLRALAVCVVDPGDYSIRSRLDVL